MLYLVFGNNSVR